MKKIALVLTVTAVNLAAFAAPLAFDFKDPKGVNNVVFRTDAPLESINGTATAVSGMVTFDPADPAFTNPPNRRLPKPESPPKATATAPARLTGP